MQIAEGDKADVERAVAAAREAFDNGPWPRMGGKQRGQARTPVLRQRNPRAPHPAGQPAPAAPPLSPPPPLLPPPHVQIMLKLAELIEANADELAAIETLDNGAPGVAVLCFWHAPARAC